MAKIELKACAHCGGEAELDYEQGFFVASGKSEKRVAIYCTECDVDMGMCYSDFPEYDHDQMSAILAEKWNRRVQHVAPLTAPGDELKACVSLHVSSTDTYPDVEVEVHDGSHIQPGDSPIPMVTKAQAEVYNAALVKKNQELEAAWLKAEALLSEAPKPKPVAFIHPGELAGLAKGQFATVWPDTTEGPGGMPSEYKALVLAEDIK